MIRFPLSAGEEVAATHAVDLAERLMKTGHADASITTEMIRELTASPATDFTPGELAVFAYVAGLVGALCAVRGNIAKVASALDMSDNTLRHQIQALGLVGWNRKWHPLSGRQPRADGVEDAAP